MIKDIYYINVEENLPTTREATDLLLTELDIARKSKYPIAKIIHGWGSHGIGGKLKEDIRLVLHNLVGNGDLKEIVYGEDWDIFNKKVYNLLITYPSLKKELDLFYGNIGVTVAVLNSDLFCAKIIINDRSTLKKAPSTSQLFPAERKSSVKTSKEVSANDNLKVIFGKFKYKIINYISGSLEDCNFTGDILICLYDNTIYKGRLKNSMLNGYGELLLPNNTCYRGTFRRGLMDGNGNLQTAIKEYNVLFHNNKYGNALLNDPYLTETLISLSQVLNKFKKMLSNP